VNFVGASHQIVYILVLYYYSKSKVSVSTLPLAMWSYSGNQVMLRSVMNLHFKQLYGLWLKIGWNF